MNINSTLISGFQALNDIGYLIQNRRNLLLVTDKNIIAIPAVAALIERLRRQTERLTILDGVPPEPSQHDVSALLSGIEDRRIDMVIGVGGGSVLDVAKLLSVLCCPDAPTLEALLAGDRQMAAQFRDGEFATTYLAPRDYHRVHMPCNGILREMIYVPGDLYSVNPLTARNIPNLFARNERVICYFDTEFGPMAQILVGATIVGSIETAWSGTVTPPREGVIKRWSFPGADAEGAVVLLKGQEMGRFKLGSTVINLFAPGRIKLAESLEAESKTRLGQPMAMALQRTDAETVLHHD